MAGKFYGIGVAKLSDEINSLLYVSGSGGWKPELLVEKVKGKLEEMFLLCSCCRGVLRDAHMIERDGKQELMCSECIPQSVTRRSIAQMNREAVNEKQVHCPFKFKGCDWVDTISQLLTHLREYCVSYPVECPLRCLSVDEDKAGEINTIERGLLPDHQEDSCPMRNVNCDYCGASVKACERNAHLQDCQSFPIPCPNGCGGRKAERRNMPAHLSKECPLQVIRCPFSPYGCEVRFKRAHIDQHDREHTNTHLNMTILRLKSLEYEMANRDSEISDLKGKLASIQVRGELEWKITDVRRKIENKDVTFSDPFYVGKYKCQIHVDWDIENEVVGCILCILKGEFDDELSWPFRFECRFILLNQLNSEDHFIKSIARAQENIESFEKPKGREFGVGVKFISHSEILTEKYMKDDCVFLKVPVLTLPLW